MGMVPPGRRAKAMSLEGKVRKQPGMPWAGVPES